MTLMTERKEKRLKVLRGRVGFKKGPSLDETQPGDLPCATSISQQPPSPWCVCQTRSRQPEVYVPQYLVFCLACASNFGTTGGTRNLVHPIMGCDRCLGCLSTIGPCG